jgi:hypothetical protein
VRRQAHIDKAIRLAKTNGVASYASRIEGLVNAFQFLVGNGVLAVEPLFVFC